MLFTSFFGLNLSGFIFWKCLPRVLDSDHSACLQVLVLPKKNLLPVHSCNLWTVLLANGAFSTEVPTPLFYLMYGYIFVLLFRTCTKGDVLPGLIKKNKTKLAYKYCSKREPAFLRSCCSQNKNLKHQEFLPKKTPPRSFFPSTYSVSKNGMNMTKLVCSNCN